MKKLVVTKRGKLYVIRLFGTDYELIMPEEETPKFVVKKASKKKK